MKKIAFFLLILTVSCQKDDNINSIQNREFLISKVFDYQDRLLANYIYNNNNQLIKREFTDPETGYSSDLVFSYSDGIIEKIEYIDHNFPQFNYSQYFFYGDSGKMIRYEFRKDGIVTDHVNLMYSSSGTLNYLYTDDSVQLNLYEYDNDFNVIKVTHYFTDPVTGENFEQIRTYSYDDLKKPSFGLDYILPIDLLPKMGTDAVLERSISKNNMTSNHGSGTERSYEYNEFGLPISVLTEWQGIITDDPMLLKIEYVEE